MNEEITYNFIPDVITFDHTKDSITDSLGISFNTEELFNIIEKLASIKKSSSEEEDDEKIISIASVMSQVTAECKTLNEVVARLVIVPKIWYLLKKDDMFSITTLIAYFQTRGISVPYEENTFLGIDAELADSTDFSPTLAQLFKLKQDEYLDIIGRLKNSTKKFLDDADLTDDKNGIYSTLLYHWLAQAKSVKEIYFSSIFFGFIRTFANGISNGAFKLLFYDFD